MPRFLTATKIGLLLLIDIYTTHDLPPTARHGLLNFLAARVIIRSDFSTSALTERSDLSTADSISIFADALSGLASSIPGRSVYHLFLTRVWTLDGLDALVTSIKSISESVGPRFVSTAHDQTCARSTISRASPFGQFIRRSNVEFARLQFADAQALWLSFDIFRASSHSAWAARNPYAAQKLPAWTAPAASTPTSSTEDTSLLLSFSIHHLQKLGHRLPQDLRANLAAFLEQCLDSSTQSLQHFLAFFEHWRAGQYTMALESLHRYFDYSIASHGSEGGRGSSGKDANIGNGNVRVYYQYALLHLSVLHADFERWEASVAAMEECIGTARENQDTPCLLLALSWLLYLRSAHANTASSDNDNTAVLTASFGNLAISSSTQSDEIAFLKSKAKELKYWSLLSSTLLDEARGELASGTATPKALEHLLQAQYLNTTHDLRTQMPATMLFQAAAVERLGHATQAHQIYESIPILHAAHLPLPERVRVGCRLANSFEHRGEFAKAIETLHELEQSLEIPGTLKSKQRILGWRMVLHLRRELRHTDLRAAGQYQQNLQPFLSLSNDPDLSFEIRTLGYQLLLKQSRAFEALSAINAHISALKQNPAADLAQQLTLRLLKTRVFTSSARSTKALSLALRVATVAHRHTLIPTLCEAVQVLSHILNDLGECEAAKDLVEAIMPAALETHNLPLTARLYATLADAYVGLADPESRPLHTSASPASSPPSGSPRKRTAPTTALTRAETFLDLAHSAFIKVQDRQGRRDCLIKKQILATHKGDGVGAEKAEAMFLQLAEEGKMMNEEDKAGGGGT